MLLLVTRAALQILTNLAMVSSLLPARLYAADVNSTKCCVDTLGGVAVPYAATKASGLATGSSEVSLSMFQPRKSFAVAAVCERCECSEGVAAVNSNHLNALDHQHQHDPPAISYACTRSFPFAHMFEFPSGCRCAQCHPQHKHDVMPARHGQMLEETCGSVH
eukprot:TRINITY_DN7659_c0_g1_i1.p1 TRINITY_DN7659_c0_g1~~TRINITY_DN7659_c0_g1_i1.p1  ORF type:complete len:163 (-),score=4.72 TRINITY_DN7659_c0_g1_i1:929-1417(-)